MGERMLAGFALYVEPAQRHSNDPIGTPPGCRLHQIVRLYHGWRLWTATNDFKHGSYLELFDDGRILNVTARKDEGDEFFWVRPSDAVVRSGS